MNKVNLKLLAEWLLENHESLMETKTFDMQDYRSDGACSQDFVSETNCGTVGCALGWAPVTGIKALATVAEDFYASSLIFWDYCSRVFGIGGTKSTLHYWDWCFADDWSGTDNTPKGAAIRIIYLLNQEDEVREWDGDCDEDRVEDYMSWWDKEGKFL